MDHRDVRRSKSEVVVSPILFAWRGGQIVLFGDRTDQGWHLARGWFAPDQLTDVRRWTFASPERFVAQVHRLAGEAVSDARQADAAARAAAAWIAVRSGAASDTI